MTAVTIAAEGICDVRAVEKIARGCGFDVATVYNCRGKSRLDSRLPGFTNAGSYAPWIIARDLDHDADCAPTFIAQRGIAVPPISAFRLAVRAMETWLIADRQNFSHWLGISQALLPTEPELTDRPKLLVANLAGRSRKRSIRERMAPRPDNGATIGPEYEAGLPEFIEGEWDYHGAAMSGRAPSLYRALAAIEAMFALLENQAL